MSGCGLYLRHNFLAKTGLGVVTSSIDLPTFFVLRKVGVIPTGFLLPAGHLGRVNAAGNYTKPGLRKKIVSQVKAAATHGTGAGQWSARKAQLVAKKYKAAGGGYRD